MEKAKGQKMYLYTPKPTYLMNSRYGGKSKTQGENHPAGAIINYYLSEVDTTSEYILEFRDSEGNAVRTFNSHASDSDKGWKPEKGSNRFIWDLRVDGVDQIKGMILWSVITSGPYVLPGNYTVSLKKDDQELTAPLTVVLDPRVSVSTEDLKAQYQFVLSGRDKMNEINKTILEIRKVNSQLAAIREKIEEKDLSNELEDAMEAGGNIEKALYQTKNKSPQDPLNFPIRLNNKYGHLIALATIGFNRPTKSMYEVREELEVLIDIEINKWNDMKGELEELDQKLRKEGIRYIDWN
jgi:hypothetical protein